MTIRAKLLLITGISVICMIGIIYATSRFIYMRGLDEIEERDVNSSVERVLGALSYLISDLEADTADRAAWDYTYTFIEDGNDEYIQSNLSDGAFITSRLNLMLFVHSSGQIVFGKAFDLENEEEMPIPQDLLGHLSGDSPLLSQAGTHNYVSGIILLRQGPVIIASQPILTSEDKGPTRGTLILARYLDSEVINDLSQLVLFPVTVRPVNHLRYPDFKEAFRLLSQEDPVFVKPLDTQHISGYSLLKDIYGKPALVLRVDMPRDTYQLGQLVTDYYILSILGFGVLLAVIAAFLIQKQILSRFGKLTQDINRITASGDTSTRISLGGRDELNLVAGTINGMLAALQESESELREGLKREGDARRGLEEEIRKRIEFTRALVHELKTPITPVLAATELLLEEIKDERLLKLTQSIDRSASNLNRRIDELLDLARGEIETLQLALETVDPLSLLKDISQEMTPVASRNKQSLSLELPSSIPAVLADRGRLRQIVLNLLDNAFKFTPQGGTVTLKAKEDGANLVVEVQDTGPGISKEDRERLFEPYYRRIEDRERLSGLGLGLALAKRFVELHGGQIWVTSRKGKGSTFGFSLPFEFASEKKGWVNPNGKS